MRVYYYTEQSVMVNVGGHRQEYVHQGDYCCPCGEEVTFNQFTQAEGRMVDGRLGLRLECDTCGPFWDEQFRPA